MADEIVETAPEPVADVTLVAESAPKPVERDKQNERIGELTYRNRQAEARILELESKLSAPAKEPELVKPTLEKSGYDEDAHKAAMDQYYEALIERKAEEKAVKVLEDRDAKAKAKSRDDAFEGRLNKLTPEQKELAIRAPVGHKDVAELIKDSEVGPEILLYLHENPEIANTIAALSESQRAKEIGRIEAKLEKSASSESKPKPVTVSKAPPPAAKIDASEPVSTKEWNDPALTQAEFNKRREQYIAKRR